MAGQVGELSTGGFLVAGGGDFDEFVGGLAEAGDGVGELGGQGRVDGFGFGLAVVEADALVGARREEGVEAGVGDGLDDGGGGQDLLLVVLAFEQRLDAAAVPANDAEGGLANLDQILRLGLGLGGGGDDEGEKGEQCDFEFHAFFRLTLGPVVVSVVVGMGNQRLAASP